MQKMWDTVNVNEPLNYRQDEGEESHVIDIDQIFHKTIEENFRKLRKGVPVKKQEAHRTTNRQNIKRKFPWNIIVETLSTHSKEKALKAAKEKRGHYI